MMDVAFDEKLGILRSVSSGTSTLAEVEAFNRKTVGLQERARARRGACLTLVDASTTAVHTQEAAAIFARYAATRVRPGDRTAIVLESAIARLQAQRMTARATTGYFTNEADALAWLLADPPASA